MKKITLSFILLFVLGYSAFSQCDEPLSLPYLADAESASVPELPDCMFTGYLTFASHEEFKTTTTAIEGFSGNVFIYNTALGEQMPDGAGTGVALGSGTVELQAGTSYTVSYKYGMSDPESVIGVIRVMMTRSFNDYIYLPEQENVTAGISSSFTSEPFTVEDTDTYYLTIEVYLSGNQGYLYFDDITLEETPAASITENTVKNLTVYPNPVKDEINLANADDVDTVTLYNITGQKVLSQEVNGSNAKINTEALSKGIYFLKATSGTAQKTIKIVKD